MMRIQNLSYLSHLSLQSMYQRVWVEEDWTIGKANLALSHRFQIFLGHACLANRPEDVNK